MVRLKLFKWVTGTKLNAVVQTVRNKEYFGNLPKNMKFLICLVAWCFLFAISWPLALFVLAVVSILWLIALPFRIAFAVLKGVFHVVACVISFPFKVFRFRS